MAHTKSAGSTKYGRDSQPKYLGVKKYDGEKVQVGDIVIRQRGSKYLAGIGVRKGSDDTLYAVAVGTIKFTRIRKVRFDGTVREAPVVNIISSS